MYARDLNSPQDHLKSLGTSRSIIIGRDAMAGIVGARDRWHREGAEWDRESVVPHDPIAIFDRQLAVLDCTMEELFCVIEAGK